MNNVLVLVRHGESEWNKLNLFTGWKDPDLTEKGIAEAKQAGRAAEGRRDHVRHRLHQRPQAGPAHPDADPRRARPVRARDHPRPEAQRARLRRPLRPQQGRRTKALGRGAGADLAAQLRCAAARRREPEGHRRPRAPLLRGQDLARGGGRPQRHRRRPRQLAARPHHEARGTVGRGDPQARAWQPACPSSTG